MPSTNKKWCPKCLRTFKSIEKCPFCKIKMIDMGKRWRFPKHNASRAKWKKELNKLHWNILNFYLKELYYKFNIPYVYTEIQDKVHIYFKNKHYIFSEIEYRRNYKNILENITNKKY